MDSNDAPPPYARTVYDETYHAKSYIRPSIMSIGNRPNLLGTAHFPVTQPVTQPASATVVSANGPSQHVMASDETRHVRVSPCGRR